MAEDNNPPYIEKTVVITRRGTASGEQASIARYLVVTEGEAQGRFLELRGVPVMIGRLAECQLFLPDPSVSKRHCLVTTEHNQVWITDLQSTNGTFLDGQPITGKHPWPEGIPLRIGRHVLTHEIRNKQQFEASEKLAEDLRKARDYVWSLLPPPIAEGPVRVDWCLVSCAALGGDGFGYYWLDQDRFVFYLVDVCGHGVGPALHSVSVLNMLRQHSLVGVDFGQPAQVLERLNSTLQMDEHGNMFFSIWYGVYRRSNRHLIFSAGGHPPAILLAANGRMAGNLHTTNLFLGMLPGQSYQQAEVMLEPGCRLCVFSDGAFEVSRQDGHEGGLEEFQYLIEQQSAIGDLRAETVYRRVVAEARGGILADDFSLMILQFW